MIQIYYEDGSTQIVRPTAAFERSPDNIKSLVASVAGTFPVKYYVSDFETKKRNNK